MRSHRLAQILVRLAVIAVAVAVAVSLTDEIGVVGALLVGTAVVLAGEIARQGRL